MAGGFLDPPHEFTLTRSPHLIMLCADTAKFMTNELHSDNVFYVLADRRCDEVKVNMTRGDAHVQDSVEVFCGFDAVIGCGPIRGGQNWWTTACGWVYRSGVENEPLSMVFFAEAYIAVEDLNRKYATYVEFLKPDVVVVTESWRRTGLHARLMNDYTDFLMLELKEGSQSTLWLYYKSQKVSLEAVLDKEFSFVNVKRMIDPRSPPGGHWNYAAAAEE